MSSGRIEVVQPRPLALPGTHERVVALVRTLLPPASGSILDVGAGEGALTACLRTTGYDVQACDLHPGAFKVPDVECRAVGTDQRLPYGDESFDLVVAVELIEHVEHHDVLFKEVARVLKPTGHFVCTTPNILSLKSRLRFFTTGYFYSFDTLDPAKLDPVSQHITPFTLDRYVWRFAQCGLRIERVSTDKHQRSSLALGFLVPLIRWAARASQGDSPSVRLQNSRAALFGRKLMIVATRIQ